ncbi:hypothetical protein WJX73_003056 [Symbiochloris irregularis]|uniref:RRM domain-containing protein n=1 Tax=Symbiochloris irregularis TaxID=706552 RepID=A0AAW1NHF4_9CHLO
MQATDRTVYVGNVGKEVDEAALLALFGHCGTVTQIRIAGDPSYETRYAFIEFTTVEESSTALLLDGMNVFDRIIKVNMARGGSGPGVVRSLDPDRVQRTVHVGGLPFDEISEETLSDYFSHVGEVNAVRKSGRFAWVEFATLQASQQALTLDGESLGSGIMKVSQSKTPIHTAGWRAPKFRDVIPLSTGAQEQSPPHSGNLPPPPTASTSLNAHHPPYQAAHSDPYGTPPPYGAPPASYGQQPPPNMYHQPPRGPPPSYPPGGAPPYQGGYGGGPPPQHGPPAGGPPPFRGGPPPPGPPPYGNFQQPGQHGQQYGRF